MSLSLSLPAVDILFEDLKLGRPPQPFEVPSVGETLSERARLRDAVHRNLTQRGLMRAGRVDADTEHTLATFARAPFSIVAVGQLDDGPLFARACSDGHFAIVVTQQENMLVFTEIRETAVVPTIVDLLPLTPAARGTSVTVDVPGEKKPERREDDEPYDPFAEMRSGRSSLQQRTADRIFNEPMRRVGAFSVSATERGNPGLPGKQVQVTQLTWFDTAEGRYFATQQHTTDGITKVTYTPGDNARIAGYLHQAVASHLP
ncbi:MAG: ESX secretion-associated protein EspG [Haloechinothrix sp.]